MAAAAGPVRRGTPRYGGAPAERSLTTVREWHTRILAVGDQVIQLKPDHPRFPLGFHYRAAIFKLNNARRNSPATVTDWLALLDMTELWETLNHEAQA